MKTFHLSVAEGIRQNAQNKKYSTHAEISEAMCLGNVDPEEILFVVRGNLAYLQRAINALSNTAEKVEAFCIEARKGD